VVLAGRAVVARRELQRLDEVRRGEPEAKPLRITLLRDAATHASTLEAMAPSGNSPRSFRAACGVHQLPAGAPLKSRGVLRIGEVPYHPIGVIPAKAVAPLTERQARAELAQLG
jgi:hypothetical protein